MTTVIEGVEVSVGRLDADWRKFGIKISVRSEKKDGHKARAELDPGAFSNQAKLLEGIGRAGALCGEYLGKRYNEDPDIFNCAHYAQLAFLEEMRLMAEMKKDVPTKLKRLRDNAYGLQNAELELLNRFEWLVNNDQPLGPREVQAIDVMIGRLHGNSL